MNQAKIGAFICACRKECGYTQASLAEKLNLSDRAISKWETGKSMPDSSIMLTLCHLLNIDVNELLSGERLAMDEYKKIAEENLIKLKQQEEQHNQKLLYLEVVIGVLGTASFLIITFTALFAVTSLAWQIALGLLALLIFLFSIFTALKLQRDAGYYECGHCKARYVPTMKQVVLAPHIGRARYMTCPTCGKRSYHKKTVTK